MKAGISVLIAIALGSMTLWGDDCDCAHFPFRPAACVRVCQAALLRKTDKKDLVGKVGLDDKTASDIVTFRKDHEIKSADTLKTKLGSDKVVDLKSKLNSMDAKDAADLAEAYDFKTVPAEGDTNKTDAKSEDAKTGQSSKQKTTPAKLN